MAKMEKRQIWIMYKQWKKLADDITMRYERIQREIADNREEYNTLYRKIESYLGIYNFILSDTERSSKVIVNSKLVKALNEKLDRIERECRALYAPIRGKGPLEEEFYQYLCENNDLQIERLAKQEKYEPAIWYYACSLAGKQNAEGVTYFQQLTTSAEYGKQARNALVLINSDNHLRTLYDRYQGAVRQKNEAEIMNLCENYLVEIERTTDRLLSEQFTAELKPIAKEILGAVYCNQFQSDIRKKLEITKFKIQENERKAREESERQEKARRREASEYKRRKMHNRLCLVIIVAVFFGKAFFQDFIFAIVARIW